MIFLIESANRSFRSSHYSKPHPVIIMTDRIEIFIAIQNFIHQAVFSTDFSIANGIYPLRAGTVKMPCTLDISYTPQPDLYHASAIPIERLARGVVKLVFGFYKVFIWYLSAGILHGRCKVIASIASIRSSFGC